MKSVGKNSNEVKKDNLFNMSEQEYQEIYSKIDTGKKTNIL